MRSIYINEAAETLKTLDTIKKELRKKLNVCSLSSFKSAADCNDFYSVFFCNSLPSGFTITAKDWFSIYQDLFAENTFFKNLINFMSNWSPETYTMILRGLRNLIDHELLDMEKNRVVYVAEVSCSMNKLHLKFDTIRTLLSKQLVKPELMKFANMAAQISQQYSMELSSRIHAELKAADEKHNDGLTQTNRHEDTIEDPISEECAALLDALETARVMIEDAFCVPEALDEGIVSTAKDRANQALVKKRQVVDYLDRTVFKMYDTWRKRKESKNHEEMMGETLKLSTAIKKIFRTFISYQIFGPIGAIITAIVSHAIDERTSKNDRIKILNDIKDELEIVDEKINIADKNSDEKAKIEMMRIRQKLRREYERISRGIVKA